MITREKVSAYVQTAAMSVAGTFNALLSAYASQQNAAHLPEAFLGIGAVSSVGGIISNLLAAKIERSAEAKEALAATLHNDDLAQASADALEHAVLSCSTFANSVQRAKLARASSGEWMRMHRECDERVRHYREQELAERLTEYLADDVQRPHILLPVWKEILLRSAQAAMPEFTCSDMEWNRLAGHLCREYPKRLYTAFKSDLEHGGAAFGGIVLRLLCELSKSVAKLAENSGDCVNRNVILKCSKSLSEAILAETHGLHDSLQKEVQKGLDDVNKLSAEISRQLREVCVDTRKIKTNTWIGLLLSGVGVMAVLWLLNDLREAREEIRSRDEANERAIAEFRRSFDAVVAGGDRNIVHANYAAWVSDVVRVTKASLSSFRAYLDDALARARVDPESPPLVTVRAFQEAGKFEEARDFALEQAQKTTGSAAHRNVSAALWTAAAKTEFELGEFSQAYAHATNAVNDVNRQNDFLAWSEARHQQGRALFKLVKTSEACELYQELIPLQIACLGKDDIAVFHSRRLLMAIYDTQRMSLLLQKEYPILIRDCNKALGEKHPETLRCRLNYGVFLAAEKEYSKAEIELKSVLDLQKNVLPRNHTDVLACRANLAYIWSFTGNIEIAERELQAVYRDRVKVTGKLHPDSLRVLQSLAFLLYRAKKYEDAKSAFIELIEMQGKCENVGPLHPDTLDSRTYLGAILSSLRENDEAEKEFAELLAIREGQKPQNKVELGRCCLNLGLALARKKNPVALDYITRAETILKKCLEADDPLVKEAQDARVFAEYEFSRKAAGKG